MKLKLVQTLNGGPRYYSRDGVEYLYISGNPVNIDSIPCACKIKEERFNAHGGQYIEIKHKWYSVFTNRKITKKMKKDGFEVDDSHIGKDFVRVNIPAYSLPW